MQILLINHRLLKYGYGNILLKNQDENPPLFRVLHEIRITVDLTTILYIVMDRTRRTHYCVVIMYVVDRQTVNSNS